jgi:endonuclease G
MSWNHEALAASFFLTNAVPQNPSLNSGRWRQLESAVRRLSSDYDSLIILTGPVFCQNLQSIGAGRVTVPCELFKVILAVRESSLTMYAAILPNDGNPLQPLSYFATSVQSVETRTGLDFFHCLPPQTQLTLESKLTHLQSGGTGSRQPSASLRRPG